MVQETDGRHSGAGGGVAGVTNASNEMQTTSTQNTQYDQIGTKYLEIKQLPAVEPEVPSILAALGEGGVKGKKCLASQFPTLHFSTHDCSIPSSLPVQATGSYDLVFSAWFLNYAGSEQELTKMFRVVDAQMRKGGRFVALTTDVHDVDMSVSKLGFYGLDVLVLEPRYVAPDTGVEVGIKARVKVGGGQVAGGFEFDVFQFRREVYERCALRAGLRIGWRGVVVPDDERRGTGYWDEWLRRPTFAMLEATRVGEEGGG
ncbi:hypothetical protein M3J09_013703 [Ascochyta lentis]